MIDSEADMEKTEIKNGSEIYGTVRELLRLTVRIPFKQWNLRIRRTEIRISATIT